VVVTAVAVGGVPPCQAIVDGTSYDLAAVRDAGAFAGTDEYGNDIAFAMCHPSAEDSNCATSEALATQTGSWGCATLARWDDMAPPTWTLVDPRDPSKGFIMRMVRRSGDACGLAGSCGLGWKGLAPFKPIPMRCTSCADKQCTCAEEPYTHECNDEVGPPAFGNCFSCGNASASCDSALFDAGTGTCCCTSDGPVVPVPSANSGGAGTKAVGAAITAVVALVLAACACGGVALAVVIIVRRTRVTTTGSSATLSLMSEEDFENVHGSGAGLEVFAPLEDGGYVPPEGVMSPTYAPPGDGINLALGGTDDI